MSARRVIIPGLQQAEAYVAGYAGDGGLAGFRARTRPDLDRRDQALANPSSLAHGLCGRMDSSAATVGQPCRAPAIRIASGR
jgi:hypothetical protein